MHVWFLENLNNLQNVVFLTSAKYVPGPGAYEPKPSLNEKGNYFVSKYRNSLATSIDPPSS